MLYANCSELYSYALLKAVNSDDWLHWVVHSYIRASLGILSFISFPLIAIILFCLAGTLWALVSVPGYRCSVGVYTY